MPPSKFQYLRRFDKPPVVGQTCTIRMKRPDGGETVSVATYQGVQKVDDDPRDQHVFTDLTGMGPLGPYATAWACFPVELTVEA